MNDSIQFRFPIGQYQPSEIITHEMHYEWMEVIASFPTRLKHEVCHLTDEQLNTPYREGGWTIRQVVNHCADSHSNCLTRFKLTLTEDTPVIRPYFEDRWGELADSKNIPIGPALQMLEGIHGRWTFLLQSLSQDDYKKKFFHPEHNEEFSLEERTGFYAWHCNHHLAHITKLKERMKWK